MSSVCSHKFHACRDHHPSEDSKEYYRQEQQVDSLYKPLLVAIEFFNKLICVEHHFHSAQLDPNVDGQLLENSLVVNLVIGKLTPSQCSSKMA
jgi:hypothetical protein